VQGEKFRTSKPRGFWGAARAAGVPRLERERLGGRDLAVLLADVDGDLDLIEANSG